jgi:hypothetical protein
LVSHFKEGKNLSVSKNRVLRKIFGPKKRKELIGDWRKQHSEFMICTPHQILLG